MVQCVAAVDGIRCFAGLRGSCALSSLLAFDERVYECYWQTTEMYSKLILKPSQLEPDTSSHASRNFSGESHDSFEMSIYMPPMATPIIMG